MSTVAPWVQEPYYKAQAMNIVGKLEALKAKRAHNERMKLQKESPLRTHAKRHIYENGNPHGAKNWKGGRRTRKHSRRMRRRHTRKN